MCKCTPEIRTPFCGKINCVDPRVAKFLTKEVQKKSKIIVEITGDTTPEVMKYLSSEIYERAKDISLACKEPFSIWVHEEGITQTEVNNSRPTEPHEAYETYEVLPMETSNTFHTGEQIIVYDSRLPLEIVYTVRSVAGDIVIIEHLGVSAHYLQCRKIKIRPPKSVWVEPECFGIVELPDDAKVRIHRAHTEPVEGCREYREVLKTL